MRRTRNIALLLLLLFAMQLLCVCNNTDTSLTEGKSEASAADYKALPEAEGGYE